MPQPVVHREIRRRRRGLRRLIALGLTSVLISGGLLAMPLGMASAGEISAGLHLWYKLDEDQGTTAVDASGNARNGTVSGTTSWGGADGLAFNGTDTYIKMPDNIMQGLDSISVATDVFIEPGQAAPYYIYGFGNPATGSSGTGYLFTTGDRYRTAVTVGNWSGEQISDSGHVLARGVWKHITYTQTGTTGVLYEDGYEVAQNTNVTVKPGAIGNGATTTNYLGRSVYGSDKYFRGKIRDFRVYNRALDVAEVQQLATRVNPGVLAADKGTLTLGNTSDVTADLALPTVGPRGSVVSWASSDSTVLGADGKVTRPARGRPDARVRLTATLKWGTEQDTKTFAVTVRAEFDDSQKATRAAAALVVHNIGDVRGNLTLPTTGNDGATVTWVSPQSDVISPTGEVKRPPAGSRAVNVNLIAKVRVNGAEASRTFQAQVPPLPARESLTGYLFSYFAPETRADGEQVYFALSKGNDALNWQEINNGKSVLISSLGEKGLRDPFIIRSPEGDKFYQIATDLKINGNWNWDRAQRTGSKSIMVWESTDLVNWTNQRLVKVSPDTAGNTWAPEAFYNASGGEYVVFWASKIYAETDPDHKGSVANKMMYATTRDFHTFSEPKVWIPNVTGSVIDSTVIEHDGMYYRFNKDEGNRKGCGAPFPFLETSATLLNPAFTEVTKCIGKGVIPRGEGPLVFKSNTKKDGKDTWYLFIDDYGVKGYVPFETNDLASGEWTPSTDYNLPARPRHGTVLPVTQAEYDRLLRTYQPDQVVN
jgi:hypothetical protein